MVSSPTSLSFFGIKGLSFSCAIESRTMILEGCEIIKAYTLFTRSPRTPSSFQDVRPRPPIHRIYTYHSAHVHYAPTNISSPVSSITPLLPGKTVVKAGLFENIPKTVIEMYCKNKEPWEPNFDEKVGVKILPAQLE